MAHPFARIFEKALAKSTAWDNRVLAEARKIAAKGYAIAEVCTVLTRLEKGRIDDAETEIVREVIRELCPSEED